MNQYMLISKVGLEVCNKYSRKQFYTAQRVCWWFSGVEWAGTSYTQGHFQLTTKAAAAKESSGPCFTIESTLKQEGGRWRVLTPPRF